MFVCNRNFECCNYQYADRREQIEEKALNCGHLIEVELVRHGKWTNRKLTDNPAIITYNCSECKRLIETIFPRETKDYPYCHCGAKMDLR